MRAEEAARKRRRRWITQGSVILGTLAVVTVIALVVIGGTKSAAGPLNMLSDGLLVTGDGTSTSATTTAALAADADPVATTPATDGTVSIVTYVDYLCPYCGQFETTNAEQITAMVTAGTATLEVHPLSILDNASLNTEYSTRSANAAACVANYAPDAFLAVNTALFASQPEENTTGLSDDDLIALVTSAGAGSDDIAACITGGTFEDWVAAETQRALDGPLPNTEVDAVTGTPTVLVNGELYSGSLTDAAEFADFVSTVAAS